MIFFSDIVLIKSLTFGASFKYTTYFARLQNDLATTSIDRRLNQYATICFQFPGGINDSHHSNMYTKFENQHLLYIRNNRKELRAKSNVHVQDALRTDGDIQNTEHLITNPSSISKGPRYIDE